MKTILIFIALFSSLTSFADAWDNLTLEEANKVVAELKENPYVFDYCDCCDFSGEYTAEVYMIKVLNTQIVTCSWNAEFYTVNIEGFVIGQLIYSANGVNTKKLKKNPDPNLESVLYMNYTWGFNKETKEASPFFDLIDYTTYGEAESCKENFVFPTPKNVKKVSKDKEYADWYKKVMM
ncbi:MAG: hypothetical protein RI883_409 [Bacteroidota bacterium]|jgi:hypothetical protein